MWVRKSKNQKWHSIERQEKYNIPAFEMTALHFRCGRWFDAMLVRETRRTRPTNNLCKKCRSK